MAEVRGQSHFKLVLLGNAGVGKSCIVLRFVRDEYSEGQETTIGAAFLTKTLFLEDCTVKVELWDTAGQERYRSLAPMYYRGASAAIVVFDVTNRESYEGAQNWVKELQRRGDANVVIALAGNKADIKGRTVEADEAREYAKEHGLIYMDTSAKSNLNVKEIFAAIARKLPHAAPDRDADVITSLDEPASASSKAGGGCCGGGGGARADSS